MKDIPFTIKVWVFLWLITITRSAGAMMAARQALRIRRKTRNKTVYEWCTAFAVGFVLYAFSDFFSIWNDVVLGPNGTIGFRTSYLWTRLVLEVIQTFGVWVVALVLMNGDSPGWIRCGLYWALGKLGAMDDTQITKGS